MFFGETTLELVVRTTGMEKLTEHITNEIIEDQGELVPHYFVSNMLPANYWEWKGDSKGKNSVLKYLTSNSVIFNEASLPDVITYLVNAAEIERNESAWLSLTMKTLTDCMFARAFENYAFATGTCVTDVFQHLYKPFIVDSYAAAIFGNIMSRYRVKLSNKRVVCYPCFFSKHKEDAGACIIETGKLSCAEKADEQHGISTRSILFSNVSP